MKLKVLPLEHWMTFTDDEDTHHNEIPPVVNRNGYYFDRIANRVWFEIDGRAFIGNMTPEYFKYDFEQLNHRPLRQIEIDSILNLQRAGIKNKELMALYYRDRDWKMIRETFRNGGMIFNRL